MLVSPLFLFDMQNAVTLLRKPKKSFGSSDDYTIIVPICKRAINERLLLQLWRNLNRTIIVDDTRGSFRMQSYVEALKGKGFKVVKREGIEFNKEASIKYALNFVETKYAIFLDDDSYPKKDFSRLIGTMEHSGADISSVVVYPSRNENFIEKLQEAEYKISMLARQNRKWLTSGACICGKTESLKRIMSSHSMFCEGGDIEVGLLAKKMKMKIIHSDFIVYTDVPKTFSEWFRQRIKWSCGNFRHCIVNFGSQFPDVIYILYFSVLVWALLLGKLYGIIHSLAFTALIILAYFPITIISNLKIIGKLNFFMLLFYPVYSLFQVTVLTFFGMFSYFIRALELGNLGLIRVKNSIRVTRSIPIQAGLETPVLQVRNQNLTNKNFSEL